MKDELEGGVYPPIRPMPSRRGGTNAGGTRGPQPPTRLLALASVMLAAGSLSAAENPPTPAPAPVGWSAPREAAARDHFNSGRWPEAAKAYGELFATNPDQAAFARNFAYACHVLGRHADALKAWECALALGFRPADTQYNLACAAAKLDRKDEAMKWLQQALAAGFSDDNALRSDGDLDSVRDTPAFRELTGLYPPVGSMSREEKWRYDLDFFARRLAAVHHDAYRQVSSPDLLRAVADLKSRVAELDDARMLLGLQRIVARIGDDHTRVPILEMVLHGGAFARSDADSDTPAGLYPVDLCLFQEGLFIRDASSRYHDLIGSHVVRVGGRTTDDALRLAAPLCSVDNDMGLRFEAPLVLIQPAAAAVLNLSDARGRLPLGIIRPDGTESEVLLEAGPPIGRNPFEWLAGRGNPNAETPVPRYLRRVTDPYWYEWVEASNVVYFQFNAVENSGSRTLAQFCTELFAFIDKKKAAALVIDLRHNGGGNNQLLQPLIHGLIRCDRINQPGRLFVIVGRRTVSAAMNAAVLLERETEAIFVGEPTGSSPNHVGDAAVLRLPCTGTQVFVSTLYWQSSAAWDQRTWIAPRLCAEPTWAAWVANRDPAMDAIEAYRAAGP